MAHDALTSRGAQLQLSAHRLDIRRQGLNLDVSSVLKPGYRRLIDLHRSRYCDLLSADQFAQVLEAHRCDLRLPATPLAQCLVFVPGLSTTLMHPCCLSRNIR